MQWGDVDDEDHEAICLNIQERSRDKINNRLNNVCPHLAPRHCVFVYFPFSQNFLLSDENLISSEQKKTS